MKRQALLEYLATRIRPLVLDHPLRVGIDGIDAAGKTTLAGELAEALSRSSPRPVLRASIDRFHNPRAIRYRQGPDSPVGYYADSFNLPALRQDLLDPLGPGGSRVVRTALFDVRADAPDPTPFIQAAPDAILVFDGIFLFRPELRPCWDFTIFLRVRFETALARAIERDAGHLGGPQAVVERYTKRYFPAQREYLRACRPAELADVVVENEDRG